MTRILGIEDQEILNSYRAAVVAMAAKGGLTPAEAEQAHKNLNATQERIWIRVELQNSRN